MAKAGIRILVSACVVAFASSGSIAADRAAEERTFMTTCLANRGTEAVCNCQLGAMRENLSPTDFQFIAELLADPQKGNERATMLGATNPAEAQRLQRVILAMQNIMRTRCGH